LTDAVEKGKNELTEPPSKAELFQIAHQWRKAHSCRRWSDRVAVPDICLSTWLWVNE
jgi:hypothetical protein